MKDLQIIMPSCDRYLHLLKGNIFLTDHFWPEHPPINVIGFKKPDFELPDNWIFHSMGKDKGKNSYSNTLIEFFDLYGDKFKDYFMLISDDAPPLRPVNHDMIEYAFDYMKSNPNVGKFSFSGARGYIKHEPMKNKGIYKVIPGLKYKLADVISTSDYRQALSNDIWNRKYFFEYLKPNLSSWQWEMQHGKNDGWRVLTTGESPANIVCHVYREARRMQPKWYKNPGHGGELPEDLKKKYMELTNLAYHSTQVNKF